MQTGRTVFRKILRTGAASLLLILLLCAAAAAEGPALERAEECLDFSIAAYETHGLPTGYVRTASGEVFWRISGEEKHPNVLLRYEPSGEAPRLIIAFEGTKDLNDVWTDLNAAADETGIHRGFAQSAGAFTDEYVRNGAPFESDGSLYSFSEDGETVQEEYAGAEQFPLPPLPEMLRRIRDSADGKVFVTGHSLGGALAQVFTYYMIEEALVPPDRIETYTFASPVPFSRSLLTDPKWENVRVYNVINTADIIPDVGVCEDRDLKTLRQLGAESLETAASLFINAQDSGGANGGHTVAGMNLGVNIYLDGKGKFTGEEETEEPENPEEPEETDGEEKEPGKIRKLWQKTKDTLSIPARKAKAAVKKLAANHAAENYRILLHGYRREGDRWISETGEEAVFYACRQDLK